MKSGDEDKRQSTRDRCFAHGMLRTTNVLGYLTDISQTGFKLNTFERLTVEPAVREVLGIQFHEIGISYFQLSAILKWRHDEDMTSILGYELVSFESTEGIASFERIRKEYHNIFSCLDDEPEIESIIEV